MQWLLVFLGSLFVSLFEWIMKWVGRKYALVATIIAAITALTAAFLAALNALLLGISYTMPDAVLTAASWILPSNADQCVAAYTAARILHWVYWENRSRLQPNYRVF